MAANTPISQPAMRAASDSEAWDRCTSNRGITGMMIPNPIESMRIADRITVSARRSVAACMGPRENLVGSRAQESTRSSRAAHQFALTLARTARGGFERRASCTGTQ